MNLHLQQGDSVFITVNGRVVNDPVILVANHKITKGQISAFVSAPAGMVITVERGNEIISQGEDA